MSRNNFKFSLIAASVLAATSSHAALYKVVEVDPTASMSADGIYDAEVTEFYGSAIEKQSNRDFTAEPMGCFTENSACQDYRLVGDSRNGSEGHSYRQEVPFNYDSSFFYTDWNRNRDYCRSELGYQTCDPAWSDKMWFSFGVNQGGADDKCSSKRGKFGGLLRERDAFLTSQETGWNSCFGEDNYFSNALTFSEVTATSAPVSVANKLSVVPTSDYYKPAGVAAPDRNSENVVVNNLANDTKVLGNTSSGYYRTGAGNLATAYRHRGFVFDGTNTLMLPPLANDGLDTEIEITKQMGRTMVFDSFTYNNTDYYIGSAAVGPFDYGDSNKDWGGDLNTCVGNADPAALRQCQNFAFATKAAVWNENADVYQAANWTAGTSRNVDRKAMQGSARAAALASIDGVLKPILVGLNSFQDGSNVFMEATVFRPSTDPSVTIESGNFWTPVRISRSTIKDGDDFVYSNSVATDINENLILIGEAKRRGDKRENGAAPNRMFLAEVNPTDGSPEARYFDELNSNSGIFFRGVGGETGAINNFNEIVGAVDAEQSTEYFGKKRRQRGFIYPYNGSGTDANRLAVFQGQPWLLDDLTNDGQLGGNNQYRVIDAADINDDGVIAATALKCDGGYDTTSHNSYCGNGQKKEKLVAVKLIPIANEAERSIQTRGVEAPPVQRSGGSLGWMALIMLGFFGLRRNK